MNESARQTIRGLAVATVATFASFSVVSPVLDVLVRQPFSDIPRATSYFMASHGIAAMLSGLLGGLLSDRSRTRVPFIVFGLLGSGLCTAVLPWVHSFDLLLVVRVMDGAFGALAIGALFTRSADVAQAFDGSPVLAAISGSVALGFLLGPILAWALADVALHLLFLIAGAAQIAAIVPILMSGHPELEAVTEISWWRAFSSSRKVLIPLAFNFVDRFTFGALAHLTGLVVVDLYAGSVGMASQAMLLFWTGFVLACPPCAVGVRRLGDHAALILGSIAYGCALIVAVAGGRVWFMGAMTVAGAFCAFQYVPCMSLVGHSAHPKTRASWMAAWNVAGSVGLVVGLVVSGILSEHSYQLAYGVAGGAEVILSLGAAGVVLLRRWSRRTYLLTG